MTLQRFPLITALLLATAVGAASAQVHTPQDGPQPDRIRAQVASIEPAAITVKVADGRTLRLALSDNLAVFGLQRAQFTDLDFGTYVGAVSERMGDNIYSPIVRDSLSWLHRGFELRIIDEKLRGIAVGHSKWDLTAASVITHGWVDDMEGRVISIKYGPTEEEETDVEITRETPVTRMTLGDRSLIKPGARVLVGAQKAADGRYVAGFIFVGKDDSVPRL